jgi:hypothetical protein
VAAERLREAAVGVVGSAPAAFGVARLMHAEGVGNVSRRSWRDSSTADLVVVAPTADELEAVPLWNELALENELRWLPVLPYDGRLAGVGPIIVPGESCCYECVRLRRAANLEYGDDLGTIEAVRLATRAGRRSRPSRRPSQHTSSCGGWSAAIRRWRASSARSKCRRCCRLPSTRSCAYHGALSAHRSSARLDPYRGMPQRLRDNNLAPAASAPCALAVHRHRPLARGVPLRHE